MPPSDAEIYEKYARELICFAAALAGPSAAEDLLAVAVLKAMSSPRWQKISNKRAYLYRTVLNEARKDRRSTQRRLVRELRAASLENHQPSPTDRDVIAAISRLTTRQRAVVYLTYWLDLPASDVASTVGISVRSVQRELAIARTRVKELLE